MAVLDFNQPCRCGCTRLKYPESESGAVVCEQCGRFYGYYNHARQGPVKKGYEDWLKRKNRYE